MTNYTTGANFERKVKKQMEGQGWFVVRSAGSHGPVDLAAFKGNEIYFVQCKKDGRIPLEEKQKLYAAAHATRATPMLAFSRGRLGVGMREVEAC